MAELLMTPPNFDAMIGHGKAVYEALKKIEIEPDILCWAIFSDRTELLMVSSLVDRIGSLPIYEMLFKLQALGEIPADFDLWDMSIYSRHSEVGVELPSLLNRIDADGMVALHPDVQDRDVSKVGFVNGRLDPIKILGRGVYAVAATKFSAGQDMRRWKHAEAQMSQLAA